MLENAWHPFPIELAYRTSSVRSVYVKFINYSRIYIKMLNHNLKKHPMKTRFTTGFKFIVEISLAENIWNISISLCSIHVETVHCIFFIEELLFVCLVALLRPFNNDIVVSYVFFFIKPVFFDWIMNNLIYISKCKSQNHIFDYHILKIHSTVIGSSLIH